jgi:hypothetical protein
MRRSFAAATAAALTLALAPAAASAASTLSVTANPAGGDTDLATSVRIETNAAGTPTGEAASIAQALPSEYANQLGSFATCAATAFANDAGPTATNCPDRSAIAGAGTLVIQHPTLGDLTSDQAFLVKTGDNRVVLWWHVTLPANAGQLSGQIPGVVTQEAGLFGPVVTYDLTTLPAAARAERLDVTYQRNAANNKAPFAATACANGAWGYQARIGYEGGTAAETIATTVACGAAAAPVVPQPSKLELARATIFPSSRTIDVLAPITARASGNVSFELFAAGQTHRWTAPVDSADGRVRFRETIPAAQANRGTGILTMRYAGDADTRPQSVRLRSANTPADLDANRPTIANGVLQASGNVSSRARGVVRVQLEYYSGGRTTTIERQAPISNGSWSLSYALTAAEQDAIAKRAGTVHSYIQFTGYLPARMRGEMQSYEVLGNP